MIMTRLAALALLISSGSAFSFPLTRWRSVTPATAARRTTFELHVSSDEREQRMKDILAEEAMNPASMKESAAAMQNMKPEDLETIMSQMDRMSQAEKDKLKEMGMDPEMMKVSLQMMKENPDMMKSVGKMMEDMTPEQIAEQSRLAQEQMKKMSPDFFTQTSKSGSGAVGSTAPKAEEKVAEISEDSDEEEEEEEDLKEKEPVELGSTDPTVIDSMFKVAELMSQPPSGGVTFQAFSTLPPITILAGDGDEDLTAQELKECWADGSLGATRLDRAGFERVWKEIQECFTCDIMDESRKTSHAKKKKSSAAKPASTPQPPPSMPVVGAGISSEQLAEQVKKISEDDLVTMLDQMDNMTPAQEAQMKAMGADPEMMRKTASMMKNNPLMRKAATMMMKNTPPEKLMEASRQAQQKMASMSPDELKKAMEEAEKNLK